MKNNLVAVAQRLSSPANALRWQAHAHDLRAGKALLGEPCHSERRAELVRAQRACRLRPRLRGAWTICHGANWRHHRRKHGDCVARGGQSEAYQQDVGVDVYQRRHRAKEEEMGRFLLGSTSVTLWKRKDWVPERFMRLGEPVGQRPPVEQAPSPASSGNAMRIPRAAARRHPGEMLSGPSPCRLRGPGGEATTSPVERLPGIAVNIVSLSRHSANT